MQPHHVPMQPTANHSCDSCRGIQQQVFVYPQHWIVGQFHGQLDGLGTLPVTRIVTTTVTPCHHRPRRCRVHVHNTEAVSVHKQTTHFNRVADHCVVAIG